MNAPVLQRIASLAIPGLLGLFLVGTTGIEPLQQIGVYDGKRCLEVILMFLLLGGTLLNRNLRTTFGGFLSLLPSWVSIALSSALILGAVSALRFPYPGYGMLELAIPSLLIFCILATAASRRIAGGDFDRLALLVVCSTGVVAATTELTGLLVAWSLGSEFSFSQMLIRFSHPRFYNQLQTFSIPLIATLPFLFNSSRKLKTIAVILIGLQWFLIMLSGGRGSVVSLITAYMLAVLLFPSNRRAWLSIHFAGLALGFVLFFLVFTAIQSTIPGGEEFAEETIGRSLTNSTGRVQMWHSAWGQGLAQPLLGSGPSRFACGLHPAIPSHPHNFPMTLLAEWGFPAFGLIMAVCAWLGWSLIAKCRREQDGRARGEQRGAQPVVRDAVGGFREDVRRRRCDEEQVCALGEGDVLDVRVVEGLEHVEDGALAFVLVDGCDHVACGPIDEWFEGVIVFEGGDGDALENMLEAGGDVVVGHEAHLAVTADAHLFATR